MNMPQPMLSEQEAQVRGLYHMCHPAMSIQPPFWYFAHPTLVLCENNQVVGFTSFTLTIMPGFGSTLYGMDVCVHPEYRGRGIAETLHAARLTIGHSVGARTFMGVVRKNNKKMAAILIKSGMHTCIETNIDDIMYVGPIKEV